jgi:hypothetical protein
MSSGNPDICELSSAESPLEISPTAYLNVAIIDTVTSHLLSDITDIDSRHECECSIISSNHAGAVRHSLGISQLSDKGLDTSPLSINDHLRKDSGVSCGTSRSSDPPFGSSQVRGVDDELVGSWVESSGSLESGDVGTVGELGHGETTNHSVHTEDSLVNPVA